MALVATRVLGAFTLALALAVPVRADSPVPDAPEVKEPDWILSPNPAPPGQDFVLSLLSYRYSCATEYAHHSVTVDAGTIALGFTSRTNPAILCPAVYKPYGPEFKLSALKPGTYKVTATLWQPCHMVQPACKSLPVTETVGELVVGFSGRLTYSLVPDRVAAGKPFTLKLAANAFNCATRFSLQSSRVQDGRITLTFHDRQDSAIKCAFTPGAAYGPTYMMAGLKAGVYEVWADRLPHCAPEHCKMASTPELAGKLVVVDEPVPPRKGWFLKDRVTLAAAPFSMTLLNHDYGNCQTEFTHTSLVAQDGRIRVSFVIRQHPDRVCVTDIRPHGPTFQVQPLKTGAYPVFVSVMPGCLFDEPRCDDIPPAVAVDTLQVVHTLGVGGSGGASLAAPAAAWRNGSLSLRLPEGSSGSWRAELLTLSGRRLHGAPVDAGKGRTADLRPAVRPERGVYLVRFTSPAGQAHTLRVAVD